MPDSEVISSPTEVVTSQVVGARQFAVVDVAYGQALRLVDRTGGGAAQLIAVVAGDQRDRFSGPNTAVLNKSVYFSTGGVLYSYFYQPMLRITDDSVGGHSLLPTPVSVGDGTANAMDQLGQELLLTAAAELGLAPSQVPFPFQAFIHHTLSDTGVVSGAVSRSKPGDAIELVAELDVRVVIVNNPTLVGDPTAAEGSDIEVSVRRAVTKG